MHVASFVVSRPIPLRNWPGNNAVGAVLVLIAYSVQKKIGKDWERVGDVKIY